MKKVLSLFALLLIIPAFVFAENTESYYTNNMGVEMSYDEYQHLVQLGFIDVEIQLMDQDTFDQNMEIEGELLAVTDTYLKTVGNPVQGYRTYEVTKDEYENGQAQNGQMQGGNVASPFVTGFVETNYKHMTTGISSYGSYYRFQNYLQWKSMPSRRSYDITGVGYNSSALNRVSAVGFHQYASYPGGAIDELTVHSPQYFTYGVGTSFQLPTSSNVVALTSKIWVDLMPNGNSNTLTAVGDYSHATSNVSLNTSRDYFVNLGGITLGTSSYSSYDEISYCTVNYYL